MLYEPRARSSLLYFNKSKDEKRRKHARLLDAVIEFLIESPLLSINSYLQDIRLNLSERKSVAAVCFSF